MIGPRITIYRMFFSAHVPDWLLERTELSPGAKLCYGKLAEYAGKKDHCWPKLKTLGLALGVSSRQATTYLVELRKWELISVKSRVTSGQSSIYAFHQHEWMPDLDDVEKPAETEGGQEASFVGGRKYPS